MNGVEIIGYANYKIYPDGRVWSKIGKGKFLKPWINFWGYYCVGLSKNGNQKFLRIHRLLMQNFKPDEYEENLQVDHKNRIRADNRLENLRMVTHKYIKIQ